MTYDDYLAHYGVLGMKWGVRKDRGSNKTEKLTDRKVRKEIKKTANARTKASLKRGAGSGTARKQIKAVVDKREKELPGFRKKVIERQNKVQKRKLIAAIYGIPVTALALANADKIEAGAKAINYATKEILFTTLVSIASKRQAAASAAQKGREFAETMGINAPNVIDLASDAYRVVRHDGFDTALNDYDDYLAHYGVLGMKWGVRKDGRPQGHQAGKNSAKKNKRTLKKAQTLDRRATEHYDKVVRKANKRVSKRTSKEEAARTQKHIDSVISAASKQPLSLISIVHNSDSKSIQRGYTITGKQFINKLNRGDKIENLATVRYHAPRRTTDSLYDNRYVKGAYDPSDKQKIVDADRRKTQANTNLRRAESSMKYG